MMYRITNQTLAILPHYDLHYQAKVMETDKEVLVDETPLAIIRENCLHYGASYEGRLASVRYHLSFQRKTPIPIQPSQMLVVFPTQAASSPDCIWLFFRHIRNITENTTLGSIIYFHNQQTLTLDISVYTLEKQLERAGMCATLFEEWR